MDFSKWAWFSVYGDREEVDLWKVRQYTGVDMDALGYAWQVYKDPMEINGEHKDYMRRFQVTRVGKLSISPAIYYAYKL
jgi:hypothetical protein